MSARSFLSTITAKSGQFFHDECTVPVAERDPLNIARTAWQSVAGKIWTPGSLGFDKDEAHTIQIVDPDNRVHEFPVAQLAPGMA